MTTQNNGTALIEGFAALCRVIRAAYAAALPVFIWGSPGIGKTAAPREVARELGIECVILDCVTRDATDFAGLPRGTSDGGAEFVPYGFARRMIETVDPLVVILDELPSAPIDVQKAVMRLLYDRTIGDRPISDQVYFIGTGNSREDRAGSSGLLEPLKSRFASLIQFRPLLPDWIRGYAIPAAVDPMLIAFLQFRPALFSAFESRADYTQSPSPRNWASAARIIAAGFDQAAEFSLLQGSIGPVAAAEFSQMRKLLETIPDPLLVLDGSAESIVPFIRAAGSAVQFTFAAALAGQTRDENQFRNGAVFLRAIGAEFFELYTMLVARSVSGIAESRTYAQIVTGTFCK